MVELNESNFVEETKSGLVLVDFSAVWCGPCRTVTPILEQLQRIKVTKVDIDQNQELTAKFKVNAVPCIVFLKNGREVHRVVGVRTLTDLQQKVDELA